MSRYGEILLDKYDFPNRVFCEKVLKFTENEWLINIINGDSKFNHCDPSQCFKFNFRCCENDSTKCLILFDNIGNIYNIRFENRQGIEIKYHGLLNDPKSSNDFIPKPIKYRLSEDLIDVVKLIGDQSEISTYMSLVYSKLLDNKLNRRIENLEQKLEKYESLLQALKLSP